MSEWQPIETAPRDGEIIVVACENGRRPQWSELLCFPYPLPAKFIDGAWQCDMGDRWSSFEPQPTHWTKDNATPRFFAGWRKNRVEAVS